MQAIVNLMKKRSCMCGFSNTLDLHLTKRKPWHTKNTKKSGKCNKWLVFNDFLRLKMLCTSFQCLCSNFIICLRCSSVYSTAKMYCVNFEYNVRFNWAWKMRCGFFKFFKPSKFSFREMKLLWNNAWHDLKSNVANINNPSSSVTELHISILFSSNWESRTGQKSKREFMSKTRGKFNRITINMQQLNG